MKYVTIKSPPLPWQARERFYLKGRGMWICWEWLAKRFELPYEHNIKCLWITFSTEKPEDDAWVRVTVRRSGARGRWEASHGYIFSESRRALDDAFPLPCEKVTGYLSMEYLEYDS